MHGQADAEDQPSGVHDHHLDHMPSHGGGGAAMVVTSGRKALDDARLKQRHHHGVAEAQKNRTRDQQPRGPRAGGPGQAPCDQRQENSHHDQKNRAHRLDRTQCQKTSVAHFARLKPERKSLINNN